METPVILCKRDDDDNYTEDFPEAQSQHQVINNSAIVVYDVFEAIFLRTIKLFYPCFMAGYTPGTYSQGSILLFLEEAMLLSSHSPFTFPRNSPYPLLSPHFPYLPIPFHPSPLLAFILKGRSPHPLIQLWVGECSKLPGDSGTGFRAVEVKR